MWDDAPAFLRAIAEEVRICSGRAQPPSDVESGWRAYLLEAGRRVPDLKIEACRATVCLGEISPGCQACKDGTWDCIFVTSRCNLNCGFCYSLSKQQEGTGGSAFGDSPEEIAANYARSHITGISFSGGEPFLEPRRLVDWARFFRERFPGAYLWIYTNGTRADEQILKELAEIGVDEIRFNTAATGYDHPNVMAVMHQARQLFPHLTVEIPAIPEQAQQLRASLPLWASLGVKYLNLHELLSEAGTNSEKMPGPRQSICLADGHVTAMHPASRGLILEIMEMVRAQGFPLGVNHCSLPNKLHQIRGRRRSLLPLTRQPHEKMVDDERLQSYCLIMGRNQYKHIHPDEFPALWKQFAGFRWVRLERTAPLGIHDSGHWVTCEEVPRDV